MTNKQAEVSESRHALCIRLTTPHACVVCSAHQSRMKHEKVHSIYNRLLGIEDIDPTLVYIQYMKFARRAEGIKMGRTIFKKAREDLRTRHHVYVTAALMEYYCSKVKILRDFPPVKSGAAPSSESAVLWLIHGGFKSVFFAPFV